MRGLMILLMVAVSVGCGAESATKVKGGPSAYDSGGAAGSAGAGLGGQGGESVDEDPVEVPMGGAGGAGPLPEPCLHITTYESWVYYECGSEQLSPVRD